MASANSVRARSLRPPRSGWRSVWHTVTRPRVRDGYLMILPSIVILLLFTFWPVIQSLFLSFREWHLLKKARPFVGLANYTAVTQDKDFWNALKNTVVFSVGTVPTRMALALALALVFNRGLPGGNVLRAAVFVPHITSMVVVSFVWLFLLDRDLGIISNTFLPALGLKPVNFLKSPTLALPSIMAMSVWKSLGYEVMVFLAGLQGIHREYLEAAAIDGANGWQVFRFVTLPLLSPTIIFLTTIGIIFSFQVFDSIYVMTEGGPIKRTEVLVYYVYYHGFETYRMGYASALAYVLFIIILVLTLIEFSSAGYFRRDDTI